MVTTAPTRPLHWDERFSFGIRAQYALPLGNAASGAPLDNAVSGVFLVGGEVGYLLVPHLTLLGYFFYGFPAIADGANATCPPTDDCSANMIRVGVALHYHFSPEKKWDPWVGVGAGYELLSLAAADDCTGDADLAQSLQGFELSAGGGVEYRPGYNFGVGPYVEAAGGYYSTQELAPHGWITFGVRIRTGP